MVIVILRTAWNIEVTLTQQSMARHVNAGMRLPRIPSFKLHIIFVVIEEEKEKNLGVLLIKKFSCVIFPSVVSHMNNKPCYGGFQDVLLESRSVIKPQGHWFDLCNLGSSLAFLQSFLSRPKRSLILLGLSTKPFRWPDVRTIVLILWKTLS